MVRAALTDKNGLRRGAWSREEDDKLRAYVLRYGHWNWRQLPRFAGLARCGKSCRLRWLNYLRPEVKHGNFSKEEEDLIIQQRKELGNKWSLIASKLPGRTDNEIKNHWHTHLKKSSRNHASPVEKQHCFSEFAESVAGGPIQTKDMEVQSYSSVHNPSDHTSPLQEEQNLPLPQETYTYTSIDLSECSANGATSRMNYYAEDSITTSEEVFQDLNGEDFWTEPFLAENNTCNQDGYMSLYGFSFDDDIDWIHQLTQEL